MDTITLDYDTEYVRLVNNYYKKISEDALAGNVLFTQEYESFLDIYTLDNLRLKSELEINYYTYEDVLTIEAINHSIVTEGGGSYISYVTNINTTTGQEYSNIELLDLFDISLDEFFVKVQKLREENSSDTYIPTIDSASLSVISGKLHVNLAVGLEYGPVLLS